ncbi:MAG: oxaloacetate decarboxylase [Bacteroidales bacterium]
MDQALMLLVVGMLTVLITLIMVTIVGNAIILFVNKFMPEAAKSVVRVQSSSSIEGNKLAAIVSAVDIATKGKGKIVDIQKQ